MRLWVVVLSLTVAGPICAFADDPPIFLLQWGSYGTGPGQFDTPLGLGIDASGNVFVADAGIHRIQKFSSAGSLLGTWGSYGNAPGQFYGPRDVAVDPFGSIYVLDDGNRRVQVFDSNFNFLRQ